MKKIEKKYIILISVLIVFIGLIYHKAYFSHEGEKVPNNRTFPNSISGWQSTDVRYDKSIISVLDPDMTIYKTYTTQGSKPINLFVAVYDSLEKSDLSHSPVVCFTGQGWDIYKDDVLDIQTKMEEPSVVKVNRILQKKGNIRMISLYWYQTPRKIFQNRGLQKISLFINRIFGNSDRNAFVRVTINVHQGEDIALSEDSLHSFVINLFPELWRLIN